MSVCNQSKRESKCKIFYLTEDQTFYMTKDQTSKILEIKEEEEILTDKQQQECADILSGNIDQFTGIKRGDLISFFGEDKYRNNGVFIYNGNQVVCLDSSKDEYGNLPSSFTVEEFGVKYWENCIEHNSLVWFTPSKYDLSDYTRIDPNVVKIEKDGYRFVIAHPENDIDKVLLHLKEKDVVHGHYSYDILEYVDLDGGDYAFEDNIPTIYVAFSENTMI